MSSASKMVPVAAALVTAATIVILASAQPRDGCALGWFFNGQACVQLDDDEDVPRRRYYYETPKYHDTGIYLRAMDCAPGTHCASPKFCVGNFTLRNGICMPDSDE